MTCCSVIARDIGARTSPAASAMHQDSANCTNDCNASIGSRIDCSFCHHSCSPEFDRSCNCCSSSPSQAMRCLVMSRPSGLLASQRTRRLTEPARSWRSRSRQLGNSRLQSSLTRLRSAFRRPLQQLMVILPQQPQSLPPPCQRQKYQRRHHSSSPTVGTQPCQMQQMVLDVQLQVSQLVLTHWGNKSQLVRQGHR